MAKILVADDNSNIQKMVGLALKDQGIDVVAVGNGEAAVRKISDVRPDLVLADVFMPVRNGYEVCKYVKEDSALSHIPVILLVGAFDPLDEQEAQRVGADGVLKKPFVPPDPLISMVKSALSRAGVAHPGANFARESVQPPLRGTDLLTPQPQAPPPPPPAPMPFAEPEPFHEPVSKKAEPLTIESSAKPLAFGSLLETSGTEEEEAESAYVTPANSKLVPERNWGAEETEEEEVEEEASGNSWRPLGGDDEIDDVPAGREDWREQAFQAIESIKRDSGKWTPTKEKADFAEEPAEVPATTVVPEPVFPPPVTPAETQPWASSTPAASHTAAAPAGGIETESFVTETPEPPAATPVFTEAPYQVQEQVQEQEAPAEVASPAEEPAKPPSTEWYSVPSSPWDTEAQKASQLSSTWDAPVAPPAPAEEIEETVTEAVEPSSGFYSGEVPVEEAELPAATEEIIREEAAQVVEETVYDLPKAETVAQADHSPSEPANANVDDVVARVLARMSPEVLQAVTREILKPVVEAIVRDELGKK